MYCAVVYYSYTGPLKSDVVFYNDSKNDSFDETAEATQLFVQRYKAEDAVQWKNIEVDSKTLAVLFEYVNCRKPFYCLYLHTAKILAD